MTARYTTTAHDGARIAKGGDKPKKAR